MQRYCTDYVGVDCNGFVGNYLLTVYTFLEADPRIKVRRGLGGSTPSKVYDSGLLWYGRGVHLREFRDW
jgi:hypothetical protein